jgi:hypothetical protein
MIRLDVIFHVYLLMNVLLYQNEVDGLSFYQVVDYVPNDIRVNFLKFKLKLILKKK